MFIPACALFVATSSVVQACSRLAFVLAGPGVVVMVLLSPVTVAADFPGPDQTAWSVNSSTLMSHDPSPHHFLQVVVVLCVCCSFGWAKAGAWKDTQHAHPAPPSPSLPHQDILWCRHFHQRPCGCPDFQLQTDRQLELPPSVWACCPDKQ